jgi:SAM-dependent MidA family methyltransferase
VEAAFYCNMNPYPAQARTPPPPAPALLAHLRAQAGPAGVLSFRDFCAAALYAPEIGYYKRRGVERVGRRATTDFYTASSLGGGVFGKLIRAAAVNLLAPENPSSYDLIELAAEPGGGVFGKEAEPFARVETRRLGDSPVLPDRVVVFANEWLDAQPFHRFVFRRGAWRELGVRIGDAALEEIELPEWSPAARALAGDLPAESAEDYHLDISLDAETVLSELTTSLWRGVLILADYGYDWADLIQEKPAGTARAYYKHEISGDLLARPGEQDLTCHVCWNRLEKILVENGFELFHAQPQEMFLMRHAAETIEQIMTTAPEKFSPARQTLLELLHPAHLGRKFQILAARRR